jgi:hypothetical protein
LVKVSSPMNSAPIATRKTQASGARTPHETMRLRLGTDYAGEQLNDAGATTTEHPGAD